MILGCILILLGLPFAACNWYSPFSEAIGGKHSSMVPPVGGLLIGFGIFSITGSWWWALLGIPSDLGLLFLMVASPWLAREAYARSRFGLLEEMHAWHDGHRTILKLFKDSAATLNYSLGSSQIGVSGKWVLDKNGYLIEFGDDLIFEIRQDGNAFIVTEVKIRSEDGPAAVREGQAFEPLKTS